MTGTSVTRLVNGAQTGTTKPRLRLVRSKPYIDAMLWIPTRLLEEGRVALLKKQLTAQHYDPETGTTTPLQLWDDRPGYIGLPRAFGRDRFRTLWDGAQDRTTHPRRIDSFVDGPVPLNEQQAEFRGNVIKAVQCRGICDFQARADTGTGKTYVGCTAPSVSKLGPLAVVVHRNRIKEGWLGSLEQRKGMRFFFGEQWVAKHVGVAQQERCDYKGKSVVVTMAPSLTSRPYPEEFYKYPGIVFIDEVHTMATPTLHYVLSTFPAAIRGGFTATPKEGALRKVIEAHLGAPSIISEQKPMQPTVYRIKFQHPFKLFDYQNGGILDDQRSLQTPLSKLAARNNMMAQIAYWRGYKRDRNCLLLSNRTDQLVDMRKRLIALGVPDEEIGMYVGSYKTGQFKLTGKIVFKSPEGNVTKHFRGLPPFKSRAVAHKFIADTKKSVRYPVLSESSKVAAWRHKPGDNEYEHIEKHCRFVLATYGIFKVGVDISRLDWGMELLPEGDVTQAVGRTLRPPKPGSNKPPPEWYTVFDMLYCDIETTVFGKPHVERYIYKTPQKLELRRRTSYRKQDAILKGINNAAEAIEAAKRSFEARKGDGVALRRG